MILAVGKGLRRCNHDRFARVDTQWVEIFHIADRNTVIVLVAYHFVFYFFPAL